MFEEIVGDKQCSNCAVCKPRSEFSPCKGNASGLHAQCKQCRREYANRKTAERTRSDYKPVKEPRRVPKDGPTSWLYPAPPRGVIRLQIEAQQAWSYPVTPAQLRAVA